MFVAFPSHAIGLREETVQDPSDLDTRFLAGLRWNFGTSTPEAVVGFRRTKTKQDNDLGDTKGVQVDFAIPLSAEAIHPTLRLLGVVGTRQVQGEIGFGIQMIDWKPVGSLGVHAPYSEAGVNYYSGDGWKPYLGIDSIGPVDEPGTHSETFGEDPV